MNSSCFILISGIGLFSDWSLYIFTFEKRQLEGELGNSGALFQIHETTFEIFKKNKENTRFKKSTEDRWLRNVN